MFGKYGGEGHLVENALQMQACWTVITFWYRCAGVLYPAGDYAEALRLTRHLVEDVAARKQMGATARAEVERLGWLAAIRRVRDSQYQRAINTYRAHKRSGLPLSNWT